MAITVKNSKYRKMQAVIEAAKCIRHWHDAMKDNSGMIVSADAVRDLWTALHELEKDDELEDDELNQTPKSFRTASGLIHEGFEKDISGK